MLGTIRGVIYWTIGGGLGYAMLRAFSGNGNVREYAMFVAGGVFVNLVVWVFKSVKREQDGDKSPQDSSGRVHS